METATKRTFAKSAGSFSSRQFMRTGLFFSRQIDLDGAALAGKISQNCLQAAQAKISRKKFKRALGLFKSAIKTLQSSCIIPAAEAKAFSAFCQETAGHFEGFERHFLPFLLEVEKLEPLPHGEARIIESMIASAAEKYGDALYAAGDLERAADAYVTAQNHGQFTLQFKLADVYENLAKSYMSREGPVVAAYYANLAVKYDRSREGRLKGWISDSLLRHFNRILGDGSIQTIESAMRCAENFELACLGEIKGRAFAKWRNDALAAESKNDRNLAFGFWRAIWFHDPDNAEALSHLGYTH